MNFCKNCVMPDTKPGVWLDDRGFCNACRAKEIKNEIDWDARFLELEKIVDDVKSKNHPFYDCIVPVSGGKDSWYQAAILADYFGLKVLCVTLSAHLPTTEGIENLNNMIEDLNVDHMKITLKPSVFRDIRRKCFLRQGEPNWAEHCAMFSSVVNTALIYEVPLVVWGEDISFEFGGLQSSLSRPSAITINRGDLVKEKTILDWLDDDVDERDVFFYEYPDYEKLDAVGIKSIYLGHFVRWSGRNNFEFVKKRGFIARREGPLPGNFLDYDNIDEKLCEINIWFKFLKFGFWRPTDQTCYDIWNDSMTRDDAVKIVNNLQYEKPFENLDDFLNFHKVTKEEFDLTVDKFRNRDIWNFENGDWQLKNPLT